MKRPSLAAVGVVLALLLAGCPPEQIIPNHSPEMVPPADVVIDLGSALHVALQHSDPDGDPVTLALIQAPDGAALSEAAVDWLPTAPQVGTHLIVVSAADDGDPVLTAYASFHVTVSDPAAAPANRQPIAMPIPVIAVALGDPVSFTAGATDPDGDTLTWSAMSLPAGATLAADGVFSWTPGAAGTFAAIFRVSDDGTPPMSDLLGVHIDVTATLPNQPPAFFGIPASGAIPPCVPFSASFEALDPEGGTVIYASPNLPVGATLRAVGSTAVLDWTPTAEQAGEHMIVLYAIDRSQPPLADVFVWPIDVVPPPLVVNAPDTTVMGGSTATLTVEWPARSCYTHEVAALPPGASYDDATSTLTWPTTLGDFGVYAVRFTAVDPGGTRASATSRITVGFRDSLDAFAGYGLRDVNLDWCCVGPTTWQAGMDGAAAIVHSSSPFPVDVKGHAYRSFTRSALPITGLSYALRARDVVVGPACGSGGTLEILGFAVIDPVVTWPNWDTSPPTVASAGVPDNVYADVTGEASFPPTPAVTLVLSHYDNSNICSADVYWDEVTVTPVAGLSPTP